jgi:hypothetical protein
LCVTIGYFWPNKDGKRTKDSKVYLAKIRDRAYDSHMVIKRRRFNVGTPDEGEALFVVDSDTDWSEGLNSFGISIVSSALQNHDDKKEGTKKAKDEPQNVSRNGVIIRQALKRKTVDEAVQYLVDCRFEGCTLVADEKNLKIVEIFLPPETREKYSQEVIDKYYGDNYNEIEDAEDVKKVVTRLIKPEDYDVKVFEPEEDAWFVRTNNGVLLGDAGYTEEDGRGYISSVKRREHTIEALPKVTHPFDLIEVLSSLQKADKDPFYCPVRLKGKNPDLKKDKDMIDIYTTAIYVHIGNTIFVRPFECTFEKVDFEKLIEKNRKTNCVILPKGIKVI